MTIEAKIIADSISPDGIRLTTMQLRYPRFIHAEFMTHRLFSRNASSSRAIPVERMIADLRRDPAMPVYWGGNKPGMQAGQQLTGLALEQAKTEWLLAMDNAIKHAEFIMLIGLHKQIANRILEPWAHINVVVTATEWDNFFQLRMHKDAQPEINALACSMWEAMDNSEPRPLKPGEWHLPYVSSSDWNNDGWDTGTPALDYLKKVSVARCARVSYLTHDGRPTTIEEDLRLYDRLVGSQPIHASPAEHQATPDKQWDIAGDSGWENEHLHGNFRGWVQYRKTLPGESGTG